MKTANPVRNKCLHEGSSLSRKKRHPYSFNGGENVALEFFSSPCEVLRQPSTGPLSSLAFCMSAIISEDL